MARVYQQTDRPETITGMASYSICNSSGGWWFGRIHLQEVAGKVGLGKSQRAATGTNDDSLGRGRDSLDSQAVGTGSAHGHLRPETCQEKHIDPISETIFKKQSSINKEQNP